MITITKVGSLVKIDGIEGKDNVYESISNFQGARMSADGTQLSLQIGEVNIDYKPLANFTIGGTVPTNAATVQTALAAVFPSAGGSAATTFTALTGTSWDGTNAYKTLSANTAITLTPGTNVSGILHIYQDATGSRTLSINGVSFTINTAANSVTGIGYYVANGTINFTVDLNLIPYTPDTTAPVVNSFAATDAHTVQATMSESVYGTVAGWSFTQNGTTITPDSVSGTTTRSFVFSETFLSTDVFTASYDSSTGDTLDASGNELVTLSGASITNNIAAFDADASTFFTAANITDTTQKNAVNKLVVDLKAASLWTNMKAVYPIVGGTAATHKYNLKNAADTDAAFRLSFLGTVTHDANGVTGNGTTGYADTFLNDTTHITGNPITIGSYSRTNGNTGFSMGCNGSGGTYIADRNSIILRTHDTSDSTVAVANQQKLIVGTRQASGIQNTYQNGTQLSNNTPAVVGRINFKYYLMAMSNSGTATGFSDKNYCFFFIYDGGMTQTEVTALTNAVNTYQTSLGRNV
jgi:hypothetical protein